MTTMKVLSLLLSINLYFKVVSTDSTLSQAFNITCDPHNDNSQRCQSESLETIADKVKENADVQINIKLCQLILTTNVSFTKLSSLTISGCEHNTTTITCSAGHNANSAAVVFSDIFDVVKLNFLIFVSCGPQINSPEEKMYYSALTMLRCRNVELYKIVIAKSRGTGLTILYPQGGRVIIESTVFKENKIPQNNSTDVAYGGGGIRVVIGQRERDTEPMAFHFNNCTFENNVAHTTKFDYGYTNTIGEVETGYGSGGGAHLAFVNGVRDVNVSFFSCKFIANQAFIGGGITVKIYGAKSNDIRQNITFEIGDSLFEQNGCGSQTRSTYFGGGAYFSFATYTDGAIITDSHYFVKNVSFIENCAEVGGGVFYYSNRGKQGYNDNENNSMFFDNCTFKSNQAHLGSAIEMSTSTFLKLITGYAIVPKFKDCCFLENFVFINQSQNVQTTAGIGTIYASLYNIHFVGLNHFESNWGTPVYVINGIVNCTNGSVSFVNNTGLQGGAMALIGSSTMIVGPHKYEFINNTAIHQGGAIYVSLTDSVDFILSRSCFIYYHYDLETDSVALSANYSNWKANITFIGNKAEDDTSGHAIYATSLHPCQIINNGTSKHPKYTLVTNISEAFSARGIHFDDNPSHPQIATDGTKLHTSRETPWMIIPGEKYQHGVTMTDDLNHSVNASLRVAIRSNHQDVELNSGFYTFTGSEIQLKGKPDHNASLFIYAVSAKQSYIKLNVTLLKCPPGFKLTDRGICDCNANTYVGLLKCDLDKFNGHLHFGYWVGLMETPSGSQELVTSLCPFCDYSLGSPHSSSEFIVLPRDYTNLSKTVCGGSRTGTVCGKCQDNYTIHFHSPGFQCKAIKPRGCNFGWFVYILSELIPVTLVFVIILIFNIRFTSGAINGFILFSQMLHTLDISASGIIVLPSSISDWSQGYQIVYGFFNLDFFNSESLSFCLWENTSALDMLAIKYVTISYTLLMIAAVIWLINSCGGRCCGKCCRFTTVKTSVIHGISTFLLICYAQCVKVSLYLLMPVYFYTDEDNGFKPPVKVWLNGELTYFGKQHLLYAIPALFFLFIVGLLPLALLLSYPLLNRVLTVFGCENVRVISFVSQLVPTTNLKPLLDSFQGCFKDNFRFFSGLYFLYRWIIPLIHMTPGIFNVYYTAVSGVLVFIITLHTICQPYIKRTHNIIDALFFANLLLVTLLSSYNYHKSHGCKKTQREGINSSSIVQLVVIYLPLVVIGAYLLMSLCKKVIGCGYEILSTKFNIRTIFIPARVSQLRELVLGVGEEDGDSELVHERILDRSMSYPKYYGINNNS